MTGKSKESQLVVHSDRHLVISEEERKEIANKHKKVSQVVTPKPFIKKKYDGMEYVEISYMKAMAEEEYTPWNWEIIGEEMLGTEAYKVHGRLTYTDALGAVRIGDMVAAHRIQKKRGTNEFVDIGNDVKAANTDCMKKALNMYLNIADDVYRNQVEDMELSDKQKNDIIELSAKISKGRLEEIIKLVANQVIHGGNFKVSYAKLKREAEIE